MMLWIALGILVIAGFIGFVAWDTNRKQKEVMKESSHRIKNIKSEDDALAYLNELSKPKK